MPIVAHVQEPLYLRVADRPDRAEESQVQRPAREGLDRREVALTI